MKERITSAIKVILMLAICITGITLLYKYEGKANGTESTISPSPPPKPMFFQKPAEEGLKEALVFYDIHHPDIVYAQAILETGHFQSQGCLRDNNLFGLYNSRSKKYHKFSHWAVSVVKYKEWIQRRYKPPEDYYKFLSRIGYASDPTYISKLKQIVKKQDDKRRYAEGDSLS